MATKNSNASSRESGFSLGIVDTATPLQAAAARTVGELTAELNTLFDAIKDYAAQMTPCSCHPHSSTAPTILTALAERGITLSGESLEVLDRATH